jgi:ABC-type molybdate transport system ATPase subunit
MTSKKEDSLHHGLDVEQAKPGCSWGSAFSAAASVKLEEVDAGFLERTQSTATPLAGIAELAKVSKKRSLESKKEKKQAKKAKRARKEEADVDNASPEEEDVSSTPVLEGQMVTNPNKDEQVMVLVDKKKKIVYSSTRKTEDGDMIAIGKLRSSGKIKWQADAFANGELHSFL